MNYKKLLIGLVLALVVVRMAFKGLQMVQQSATKVTASFHLSAYGVIGLVFLGFILGLVLGYIIFKVVK
jgi:uncharacterized membrane protein